jgi:tetratricopeptide (TPR) repeat protein
MVRLIRNTLPGLLIGLFLHLISPGAASGHSLPTDEQVSDRIDSINNLGGHLIHSNMGRSNEFARQALDLSLKAGYRRGEGVALNTIASNQLFSGDYDSAIINYEKAITIFTEIEFIHGLAYCYSNLGVLFQFKNEFYKALEIFEKALELESSRNNMEGIASSYHNIGSAYFRLSLYDKSLDYYLLSLSMYEELKDEKEMVDGFINIACIYGTQGFTEKALEMNIRALELGRKYGNTLDEITALLNVGECHITLGDLNDALIFLNQALVLCDKMEYRYFLGSVLKKLGKVYRKKKQYNRANDYFFQALSVEHELDDKRGAAETLT